MAGLIPEVWRDAIFSAAFPSNEFVVRSLNFSDFADKDKVHMPNAGPDASVVKNRTSYPASAKTRTDTVQSFDLNDFSIDPVTIRNTEKHQLSYDKVQSVTQRTRQKLTDVTSEDVLFSWLGGAGKTISTTGAAVPGHTPDAIGNRKAFTKADVQAAWTALNEMNVPLQGRCLLIDAQMQDQLMSSLSDAQSQMFLASADLQRGVLGNLYGFDIYSRSRVGVASTAGVEKEWDDEAVGTDNATALAWQEAHVCRAIGDTEMFVKENDPLYYGDVISGRIFAGGSKISTSGIGIVRIIQSSVS